MKKINPIYWLIAGLVILTMSHLTINIEIFAWIASVPFLIYLSKTKGFLSRLWFILILILAWSFSVAKIMTDPLPWFLIPVWSVPMALIQAPAYLIWAKFKNRKFGLFIFPALMIISEWVQHTFTPLASWGAWAYTQVDNIILMQTLALFGLAGLSFLIHWVNISIAQIIILKRFNFRNLLPLVLVLSGSFIYGSIRYDLYKTKSGSTLKVATVGTDSELGGLPIPSKQERDKDVSKLFKRTLKASNSGSELIVWNEAALVLFPQEETEFQDSLKQLALESNATLVAAYIVVISEDPFRYENKYLLLKPDGSIITTYNKHHPVPGEPAQKGKEEIEITTINNSNISGAICYDYDFPSLSASIGKKSADVVALPSSDWRGIDPIHTKMAAFRAVEQGHSVVRSTRFGLSALINPLGEMIGQQSSFDENDKILMGNIPQKGIKTLYSIIGDLLVYLCIGFLIFFFAISLPWNKLSNRI